MDLRRILDQVLASETDHARRLVKSAALISEALRLEGLEATVVGGSAIELERENARDAYEALLRLAQGNEPITHSDLGPSWTACATREVRDEHGSERVGPHSARKGMGTAPGPPQWAGRSC